MYTWLILSWSALSYPCTISDIWYSSLRGTSKSSCGGTVQRAGSWEAGPHPEVIWTEGKRDVYWFHTCLIPEIYNVGPGCWFHVVEGWYFHSDDCEEYCLLGCNTALHVWNVTVNHIYIFCNREVFINKISDAESLWRLSSRWQDRLKVFSLLRQLLASDCWGSPCGICVGLRCIETNLSPSTLQYFHNSVSANFRDW